MNRLQTRLIIVFALVLLIPTAIITIYGSTTITNQLIENARANALQNNRQVAVSVESILSRARSDVLFLSRASAAKNYIDLLAAGDRQASRTALSTMQTIFLAYTQNIPLYD